MKNPFSSDVPEEKKLVRNVFDLGRSSVFTTEFGQLYPFFLQEVIPGDSVQLDAQVGLRGMPTLFPLQTKMRCSIEFYYVRNRTLYKDWEDFIYKTKDVEAPWLKLNNERAKQMISTGSLGDALGVTSTYALGSEVYSEIPINYFPYFSSDSTTAPFSTSRSESLTTRIAYMVQQGLPFYNLSGQFKVRDSLLLGFMTNPITVKTDFSNLKSAPFLCSSDAHTDSQNIVCFVCYKDGTSYYPFYNLPFSVSVSSEKLSDGNYVVTYSISSREIYNVVDSCLAEHDNYCLYIGSIKDELNAPGGWYTLVDNGSYFDTLPSSADLIPSSLRIPFITEEIVDSTDDRVISFNPFVGANPDIKISSLPFRAYEQCMNYYYRNDKNNPYVIDNQVQYNEFIPTHDGGADENVYGFHYRNWELDRFTSAVPSPQFGEAPLVGLTYNPSKGTATLKLEGASVTADDGTVTQTDPEITVGVDSDGKLDSIIDFSKDVPSANLRKLQEQMQSNTGISINDLRVTNSFQRFLENTMRRGLRYRNQLKSHHHVSVDYPDIDVPQYIGGASGIVDTGQVTNMSQTGNVGLGDYIGTLAGGVSLKHKIQQYCVEHGWIIGIVSVCPLPSYPQSINKSLIKTNPFDYYLPEFGKIGYVPIHYSELMPLQTGPEQSVDDIFGYQKAWYDYMQAFDEVHGDFRISLKDFVLTRTFAERPQLSESFTVIDPEQLNDVFLANNIATPYGSTARWMCRSNVSCIMKRQIPMIGTPSLE